MAGSSPGPIADRVFDSASRVAAVGGLVGTLLLYWSGVLSVSNATHLLYTLLLFPVYLLAVATVLGLWLGYDTDASDLERVRRSPDPTDSREGGR